MAFNDMQQIRVCNSLGLYCYVKYLLKVNGIHQEFLIVLQIDWQLETDSNSMCPRKFMLFFCFLNDIVLSILMPDT